MRKAIPKTHQALDWIGKGLTAAQAARKMEISESSVYAALRKTRAKDFLHIAFHLLYSEFEIQTQRLLVAILLFICCTRNLISQQGNGNR